MTWEEFLISLGFAFFCVLAFCVTCVVGVVVGTGAALACCLVPLGRVGRSDFAELAEPMRVFERPPDSDPAVADYWHGPAAADLAYVRQLSVEHFRTSRDGWIERVNEAALPSPTSPRNWNAAPAYGFGAGLAIGSVPGGVLAVALHLIQIVVVVVLTLAWRATGLLLRGLDSVWLRIRSIRMRCVACFRRMPYPAYRCPNCRATHWDIRPGPSGIVRRSCLCGERLPTLLMLGSRRLDARCAFRGCGAELPHGPGTLSELVVPVFGAPAAGKTRLMYALVSALQQAARRSRSMALGYADDASRRQFENALQHLDPARSTEPTPPALQRGQSLRLRLGRRTRFLQFFDAAGERFTNDARSSELLYLEGGRTFVLVVDPLSTKGFWDGIPTEEQDRLEPLRYVAGIPSPDLIYQQTAEQILQMGGSPERSRLAIALSRADQLGDARGEDLEEWTRELGLSGLVRNARMDFREVRLFRTAAVSRGDQIDNSIVELLTWLLATPELDDMAKPSRVGEAV